MIERHGGSVQRMPTMGSTTHIIGMNLNGSKTDKMIHRTGRKHIHVVKSEWVLDSIRAKTKLREFDYRVVVDTTTSTLHSFVASRFTSTPSHVTAISPRCKHAASTSLSVAESSASTTQSVANGNHTARNITKGHDASNATVGTNLFVGESESSLNRNGTANANASARASAQTKSPSSKPIAITPVTRHCLELSQDSI
jgi:hypothetical protein